MATPNNGYSLDYNASRIGKLFHASKAFVRGVMGPVGSGKSVMCCMEIFNKAISATPCKDGVTYHRGFSAVNIF